MPLFETAEQRQVSHGPEPSPIRSHPAVMLVLIKYAARAGAVAILRDSAVGTSAQLHSG